MQAEAEDPVGEELPADVREQVAEIVGDAPFRLSVATDITLAGAFDTAWLLATDESLIAVSPNGGSGPTVRDYALVDIDEVEVRDQYGSGLLRVRTAGAGATMAVFSKSLIPTFAEVPSRIEELVQASRAADSAGIVKGDLGRGKGGKGHRCPTCDRVIPRWHGVCPACLDKRRILYRLLAYARPHWRAVSVCLLLMLVATSIGLTPPLLMGMLIDDVLAPAQDEDYDGPMDEATAELGLLVVLLMLVHVSRNGLDAWRSYFLSRLGQQITFDLRNQVYRHLHDLSLSFYNQRETGRIMASVTQDVGRLQNFISDGLQEVIRDVLTIAIICVILFWKNASLAVLVLLPTPLLVVTTLYFGKRLHVIYRGLWRRWAGLSALLADTIPGVRVVKAFAQERREVGKFEGRSRGLRDGEVRVARVRSVFGPIMTFVTSLGTLIIWWVGGRKVLGGDLSLGDFVAFTGYMWQFYGPVESLCRINHRFQRAATSAERVFEVLDTQPEVVDRPTATAMPAMEGRVEFCGVTFGYEPGKPILKGLDFAVEPGEMIGLAGHSGAGKSTLINLICRFYDVDEGKILIDGQDVRGVQVNSMREQIGVVLQDPFLFNGSVADNIAYGRPGAGLEEIVAAAKAANAHDFVMKMADGYDTVVGERGVRVSGGERQRLSIARAILRGPRILILDEATSNVDTETEAQIQEALARLVRGRTTFAIAHRLSTLKHADRLLILEAGELAEIGTHDELIERDGIYARLCSMQTELSRIRAW